MKRQTPQVTEPPAKPIPFPHLFERALVGVVAALIVARPVVSGDDPGRSRLISGGGPVSFNLCVFLVLAGYCVWRVAFARTRPTKRGFVLVPLLLAAVGIIAF